jgi:hypothetical protein
MSMSDQNEIRLNGVSRGSRFRVPGQERVYQDSPAGRADLKTTVAEVGDRGGHREKRQIVNGQLKMVSSVCRDSGAPRMIRNPHLIPRLACMFFL